MEGRWQDGANVNEWLHTLLWVWVCSHAHVYVRVCASVTKQIPLEPVMVQKSHAVPMLTDTKQWVPAHTLSLSHFHPALSSSSPLLFILSLLPPLLPLSSHFVFSWFSAWPHLWENNYQMGTPCFNSDFEVSNSITFAGLFCSRLWYLPMLLFHICVQSGTALGATTMIPHWQRSWRGTHSALRLGTLCPCSDVLEWWLWRMWHGAGECQPIKFSLAKAIFEFQMLCWIARKNVLYIFFHMKTKRNCFTLQRKKSKIHNNPRVVVVCSAGFSNWFGHGAVGVREMGGLSD